MPRVGGGGWNPADSGWRNGFKWIKEFRFDPQANPFSGNLKLQFPFKTNH